MIVTLILSKFLSKIQTNWTDIRMLGDAIKFVRYKYLVWVVINNTANLKVVG